MAKDLLVLALFLHAFLILLSSGVDGANENRYRRHKPAARMFVFGDSYADTGNIADPSVSSWKVPYGCTFPGKPSGRFSDGRILTDYLAKFVGFTSPIPSSRGKLAPHKARHGMNFAYGGAGAFDTIATMKMGFPNITTQIDSFRNMLHGNDAVKIDPDLKDSIAYVSCVGNDYNTYITTGGSEKELPSFVVKVVDQLALDLQRLKSLGVAKILVSAIQPLGCLPQSTAVNKFKQCNANDNLGVQQHNQLLKQAVDKLNKQGGKNSGAPIFILDLYNSFFASFKEKHGHSGRLRFKDALRPCCIPNNTTGSCGDVDKDGNKLYTLCDNPADAFFWDSYHPTEEGWKAVFAHLKPTLRKIL